MSAKTSAQPGRRTPLSLSGAVTKTHPNKGGNNAANSGGNNANGHTTSNANKQDNNKVQQSKAEQQQQSINTSDVKENPNKKQQQADKKQQNQQNENNNKKTNEKNQNGVNNNKQQQANENKQQNKDKQQQQNGSDNKSNEKDKKEKVEKTDKSEKQQEKQEKEETKVKEDKKVEQDKADSKKEDKKPKEGKDAATKEDKKDALPKTEEKTEKMQNQVKKDDKKLNEENQIKNAEQKSNEKVENMDVVEEQQTQQKSPPVTPKTNSKANKTSTPVNKTPTKATEKTPQKSTPSNTTVKTTPVTKREVTTTVDDDDENDIEMEPLAIESSPIKPSQREEVAHINIAPSATSTPGKILLSKRSIAVPKSDVQLAMQTGISPERPRAFSQISGRKSIRPISDYTPSKFQSNLQFRESYRRINTELDVTNTSMNVTVGSEVPSNLSFSFFGRGRKRERTPPQHSQSAIGELQTEMEISPPKRARLDMHGFFSVVSSPLSLLRNRFSKATLQSSTPVKLQEKLNSSEDEIEVQNVSGVSVHEEISKTDKEPTEINAKTNDDNDATLGEEAKETNLKTDNVAQSESEGREFTDISLKCEKTCGMEQTCEQSDIKIKETPLQPAVGDPMAKNKRCIVM